MSIMPNRSKNNAGPTGTWTIAGKSADGTPYSGTAQIHPMEEIYTVTWLTTLGDRAGLGFFTDGHFLAGCSASDAYGVTLYNINDDGTLDGRWTTAAIFSDLDIEKAVGGIPDRVEGTYKIRGTGTGGSYQGQIEITQSGEIYRCLWSVGNEYEGVGFRVGNKLIFAWGGQDIFVLDYHIQGDRAIGRWAVRDSSTVGSETLDRIG